jgi:TolB-like protein/Tfp pilus assembly protein PilF
MPIWSAEIKEIERLYESLKGHLPDLEKELERLIKADDENMILLYSRRCLEVIITDLCECELKRPRKTEPLQGIIDKLKKEEKVPSHIIASMHGLNELSTYGAHPKDFDPEQVKPVLVNLDIIIKWYLKYNEFQTDGKSKSEEKSESKSHAVFPSEKSIAVLPFVNMSPEKDQDYFCDGITEEIINALAHIENFKVISRTSAFAFKDKQVDIREIGRILDVETLLEGSIRKAGDRLRITAQLIKVVDGSHIWSERYDREMKDVFAIQDEITMAIVENLKIRLVGESKNAISAKPHSENLEAYNLYLKGTHCWQTLSAEGFKKALEYFKEALLKDPKYANAYAGLASVITYSSAYGSVPPEQAHPRAIEYVNKALSLDNTLEGAYSLLGILNTYYYWNWKEAESNFRHSLQINPNRSLTYIHYAISLTCTGRHEEAISMAKCAQELDPLSSYVNAYLGAAYVYAGQPDRAIEGIQMTIITNPHYHMAHLHLALAYLSKSMFTEMIYECERAVELSNGSPFAIALLFFAYYQTGQKDLAEKVFENLKLRSENEYILSTSFYLIHKIRGEEGLALEWLLKACKERDIYLPWYRASPIFIPEGSKYMALVKEMGLDF